MSAEAIKVAGVAISVIVGVAVAVIVITHRHFADRELPTRRRLGLRRSICPLQLPLQPPCTNQFSGVGGFGLTGPGWARLPTLPDYMPTTDEATAERPFRMVTAPARQFLNTTFTETSTSRERLRTACGSFVPMSPVTPLG